jgi:spermidine synthase
VVLRLFIVGFGSILGQVIILRELNVAFYGVELIYTLAIGVWLLGTAAGVTIGRRRFVPSRATISGLLLLFPLLLFATVALVRYIRVLFGGVPGGYLSLGLQILALVVVLCPIAALMGLAFQWVAKAFIGTRTTLARAYAIESAGGLIGGLASTLLMMLGVQNLTAALFCGIVCSTLIFAAVARERGWVRSAAALLIAGFLVLWWYAPVLDRALTRINHPYLAATRDTPYSRITITQREDQRVVFENDVLSFESHSTSAEDLVHVAAIQRPKTTDVLVLGGGAQGILREVLKHTPQQVDYVELDPVRVPLLKQYFPAAYTEPLSNATVKMYIGDPRNFLSKAVEYDLILVGESDAASAQSNRFYTAEFFTQCRRALTDNGVLALRLRSSENIWTHAVTQRNASIYRALKAAFADAVVVPGLVDIFLASDSALSRNPDTLAGRLAARSVTARRVTPQYVRYLYTNDRFAAAAALLDSVTAPINSDTRPVCYRYASTIWLSKFIPSLINWDADLSRLTAGGEPLAYGGAIVILSVLFILLRRWRRGARLAIVAVAGFAGMVIETVLILYYQAKSGVLFQNLGILLMMFMLGLTAGSAALDRLARQRRNRPRDLPPRTGFEIVVIFVALCLGLAALIEADYQADLVVTSLLQFSTGALVAGLFAYATLRRAPDQIAVVSPLYAADLLGGCAGAVLGSLILVPLFGMTIAVLATAALLVLSALLIR